MLKNRPLIKFLTIAVLKVVEPTFGPKCRGKESKLVRLTTAFRTFISC